MKRLLLVFLMFTFCGWGSWTIYQPHLAFTPITAGMHFDGSDDYILTDTAVATSYPITIVAMIKGDNATHEGQMICIVDKDSNTQSCGLGLKGNVGGDPIYAFTYNTAWKNSTSNGYQANTWHHLVGVIRSNSYRQSWLDGVEGTANTDTTANPSGYDRTAIGGLMRASHTDYFDGVICEVKFYNKELNQSQITDLYNNRTNRGYGTNWSGCIAYYPLDDIPIGESGDNDTFKDEVGGVDIQGNDGSNASGLTSVAVTIQ